MFCFLCFSNDVFFFVAPTLYTLFLLPVWLVLRSTHQETVRVVTSSIVHRCCCQGIANSCVPFCVVFLEQRLTARTVYSFHAGK